jgi:F0F1-type ATP synthase delta subunit
MLNEEQIQHALSHLKAQKRLNIAAALKKFNVLRQTLSDRFHGHRVSHAEATVNTHLKLSPAQKKTLITYINKLSDRELFLTSKIIRNLA